MDSVFTIALGAILMNNFIFSQFLGCCPFLGCSTKVDTAVGMGIAVTFVMGLASALCYAVNLLLVALDLGYMSTLAFILVIAVLGVVLLNVQNNYNFIESVTYGITGGLGFMLAIVLFASVRDRLQFADYPESFDGFPIALTTAGLLALAFMGFSGMSIS